MDHSLVGKNEVRYPTPIWNAGLYEMPLQLVENDSSPEEDNRIIDVYLQQILGFLPPNNDVEIIERKRMGNVSHTFSHIQLTLRVQLLVLEVSHPQCIQMQNNSTGLGLAVHNWTGVCYLCRKCVIPAMLPAYVTYLLVYSYTDMHVHNIC